MYTSFQSTLFYFVLKYFHEKYSGLQYVLRFPMDILQIQEVVCSCAMLACNYKAALL